jgi:hypothetical protein
MFVYEDSVVDVRKKVLSERKVSVHEVRHNSTVTSVAPSLPTPHPIGLKHAEICRSNKCGRYNSERDACEEVVKIYLAKGIYKSGAITYIESHPEVPCPLPEPLFTSMET